MKNFYIFVEGKADKRFIEDYLTFLQDNFHLQLPNEFKDRILTTGGWTVLGSGRGQSMRNKMSQNTLNGGVNLIIFDADTDPYQRKLDLESFRMEYNLSFEVFLFPDNTNIGALEDLLEKIINPDNQCVLDCRGRYETDLSKQSIIWKQPQTPTTPSSKSKIYAYLESLVGTSKSEKELIKDPNRDFSNQNHWKLEQKAADELKSFLLEALA